MARIYHCDDLVDRRFGSWLVVRRDGVMYGCQTAWFCECDCGAVKTLPRASLVNGKSKSCGCKKSEYCRRASTVHGGTRNRKRAVEHKAWSAMHQRCSNPNEPSWKNYGARGISVCERWKSFASFLEDMGIRPDGLSLERVDVNGNYEPKNCRWVTKQMQERNKRLASSNRTGFRGVGACEGLFRARITAHGKEIMLGRFASCEGAVAARLAAEERYWCGSAEADACPSVT